MRRWSTWCLAALAALAVANAKAVPLTFELVAGTETASGPPYPTAAIQFNVRGGNPLGPMMPVEILALRLESVSPGLGLRMEGSTSRVGLAALIDFRLNNPPDPNFPDDVFIIPCLEPSPLDGSNPRLNEPPDPTLGAGGSFFDVFFDVTLQNGMVARHTVRFEVGAGQPFTFADPTAELGSIDIGFHLLLDPGGTPNPDAPLFRVTITGDLQAVPEPGSLALFGLGFALLASLFAPALSGAARHRGPTRATRRRSGSPHRAAWS